MNVALQRSNRESIVLTKRKRKRKSHEKKNCKFHDASLLNGLIKLLHLFVRMRNRAHFFDYLLRFFLIAENIFLYDSNIQGVQDVILIIKHIILKLIFKYNPPFHPQILLPSFGLFY